MCEYIMLLKCYKIYYNNNVDLKISDLVTVLKIILWCIMILSSPVDQSQTAENMRHYQLSSEGL